MSFTCYNFTCTSYLCSLLQMRFKECRLTAVGQRPVLLVGEIVHCIQPQVGLYERYYHIQSFTSTLPSNTRETRLREFDDGIAYMTSHRLIWCDASRALCIHLQRVSSFEHTVSYILLPTLISHGIGWTIHVPSKDYPQTL